MIKTLLVKGYFMTNCYFFIDDETKHGFLVDPAAEEGEILKIIDTNGFVIEKILLTHGHFDHTGEANRLSKVLNAPIFIHEEGKRYVKDTVWNLSKACGLHVILDKVDYIKDHDIMTLDANPNVVLEVIHTPGHTPDGVVYYSAKDKVAFVGDTIFAGSIGSSDYYGGDKVALINSIVKQILTLPEDTILYSGHSKPTTVGVEKKRICAMLNK